jgi:hypothetical protein
MFWERNKRWCMWISLVLIGLALAGCSTLERKEKDQPPAPAKKEDDRNKPVYHEFTDVLIPSELKPDLSNSFLFETAGLSAGVLRYTGRVELNSLITFFERNMRKDNWRRISMFKSPRTILLFQKDNRWCVIQIVEGGFKTEVVVWVAPTLTDVGTGN